MSNEAIQFDTHKFVKNLVASGFTEQQAESLANEQINLINSNLATKVDIEQLRLETKADIAGLKADLLKWMMGALIAQGTIVVSLIAFIVKF